MYDFISILIGFQGNIKIEHAELKEEIQDVGKIGDENYAPAMDSISNTSGEPRRVSEKSQLGTSRKDKAVVGNVSLEIYCFIFNNIIKSGQIRSLLRSNIWSKLTFGCGAGSKSIVFFVFLSESLQHCFIERSARVRLNKGIFYSFLKKELKCLDNYRLTWLNFTKVQVLGEYFMIKQCQGLRQETKSTVLLDKPGEFIHTLIRPGEILIECSFQPIKSLLYARDTLH